MLLFESWKDTHTFTIMNFVQEQLKIDQHETITLWCTNEPYIKSNKILKMVEVAICDKIDFNCKQSQQIAAVDPLDAHWDWNKQTEIRDKNWQNFSVKLILFGV